MPSSKRQRYHGFELTSVCWGYRDLFERTIEGLFAQGAIGPERREVTETVFETLKQADQGCYDHVLKEFLAALNPRTRWLLDLPAVFTDVVALGWQLARKRLHYGIRYFETLGAGGFGDSPEQVRLLLRTLRRLAAIDDDLALAFLSGHRTLIDRLKPGELEMYIRAGVDIYRRNKPAGRAFMATALKSSEIYIAAITRECRLEAVQASLGGLVGALTGRRMEVTDLGRLDSDDLIERGSTVVCIGGWLHLPHRVRDFDTARANRAWYTLAAVAAAGAIATDSFPRIHGHPRYRTCRNVAGSELWRVNLFQITEYVRVLAWIRRRWPGARRLIEWALRHEGQHARASGEADGLFLDAAGDVETAAARLVADAADASANLFDTAGRLGEPWAQRLCELVPALASVPLAPPTFLPDFLFPASLSAPPRDSLVADLKQAARAGTRRNERGPAEDAASRAVADEDTADAEADEPAPVEAAHLYDEWSQDDNDYYRNYCRVYERRVESPVRPSVPDNVMSEARKIRRVFERLKPDLARKEKRLRDGDVINPDLLLDYLIRRRREPAPRVNFYEKPRIARRDLAVVILLDVSGSTGEMLAEKRPIIDIEKHAALILGQGLASLGDRFAVCGFSSSGRDNCLYHVFKDFGDAWDRAAAGCVMAAAPGNSTRIGPALRHAGWKLEQLSSRRRLIVLITDGRPMDSGYDPNTRYAQHDVRMACEENARRCVQTLGVSTEVNSVADMEIMFPQRRFVILPDLSALPRVLPRLYVKLTA